MTARFSTKVPSGPGGFGLLTFLLRLRKDPLGFLTEAARRYGDLVFLGWVEKRVYLLNHPRYVNYVLQGACGELHQGPAHRAAQAALWSGAHDERRGVLAPAASHDSAAALG